MAAFARVSRVSKVTCLGQSLLNGACELLQAMLHKARCEKSNSHFQAFMRELAQPRILMRKKKCEMDATEPVGRTESGES